MCKISLQNWVNDVCFLAPASTWYLDIQNIQKLFITRRWSTQGIEVLSVLSAKRQVWILIFVIIIVEFLFSFEVWSYVWAMNHADSELLGFRNLSIIHILKD
jgi:hypothetical protein